jgi:hypothetical protein
VPLAARADRLVELQTAFAAAQRRPADLSGRLALAGFLDEELAGRLEPAELAVLFDYAEHREAGLAAARRGRLLEATRRLACARALLPLPQLSEPGRLAAFALLEPAEAYVEYRRERYDDARRLLAQAAALDDALASDFGWAFMRAHRLQIEHNVVRIHARLGEDEEAALLAAGVLDDIELHHALDTLPSDVLEFFFETIIGEVALLVSGRMDRETEASFRPLARHAVCAADGFSVQAHGWARMKSLALAGDVGAALEAAIEVVRRGRCAQPMVWFATLADAAELARSLGGAGERVAERLRTRAAALADAPPGFERQNGTKTTLQVTLGTFPGG